ncbi:MAG TPA: glycosyltransferase family 4 protein [Ilumatobacteraceae bacterium]|nr:glycosyltransferase family 4 protein [Ilumatobacteraceae bacterium]
MRLLWYWPHPHREASAYPIASMREGDCLTVQALPTYRGEHFDEITEYTVVRDLPDPTRPAARLVRPLRRVLDMLTRVRRRRALLRAGFDLLLIETITYEVDAFDMPRLARKLPVIAVVHDVDPHVARLPQKAERWLRERVYRSGATFAVYHQTLADLLTERYGVPPSRVHVLPYNLVDDPEMADAARSVGPPTLLFFGAMRANKGLDVLAEALPLVTTPDVRLVIAGGGDPDVEALAHRLAATDPRVVAEVGFVSEPRKRELLAMTDVVVLPYTTFNSQSALLWDAYRARLPLVVSDVGALGPAVREDGTGEVVPPRDPVALAAAIDRVLSRPRQDWRDALDAAVGRHGQQAAGRKLSEVYVAAVDDWRRRNG